MPLSQRQREYLKLMGIPVWNERGHERENEREHGNNYPDIDSTENIEEVTLQTKSESSELLKSGSNLNTIESNAYKEVDSHVKSKEVFVAPQEILKRDELPQDWSKLIDVVADCKRCELHQSRTQTVFGIGDTEADWMIIGEAPSAEDDQQGEPFVGRAGQLLTTILGSIGLSRERVYIANTLKCRTPNNRDPKLVEAAQCRAYLDQQIALVDPKIILCVGRIASQNLLVSQDPLSRLRGKVHQMIHPSMPERNIPIVVTYHPAYLLRSPSQKRKLWEDLKMAYSIVKS